MQTGSQHTPKETKYPVKVCYNRHFKDANDSLHRLFLPNITFPQIEKIAFHNQN